MFARVLVFLLLVTSAIGQTTDEAKSAEGVHYPRLIRAEIPFYPPAARAAHFGGTVEIQVTVENGAVLDAQVQGGMVTAQASSEQGAMRDNQEKLLPYLSLPSVANIKTWQFQPEDHSTFLVKYVYKIEGEETPLPENPKVQLDLPHLVTVTVRPVKPSCSDCSR